MPSTYPPSFYSSNDAHKMRALIKQFPFADLLTNKNGVLGHTKLPVILKDNTLLAHIDIHNPQVEALELGDEITVIFSGPHTYISPNIYSTTQLPTWNYMYVSLKATINEHLKDAKAKKALIELTEQQEQNSTAYSLDIENKKMEKALPYILTFSATITNWHGRFKLSQDKNEIDQQLAKKELLTKTHLLHHPFIDEMYNN